MGEAYDKTGHFLSSTEGATKEEVLKTLMDRHGKDAAEIRIRTIDKPYAYHKPSEDGLTKINRLRAHFSEGERLIKEVCPTSRHQSVALTQNETTAMWAIKAVVFNDPKSEADTSDKKEQ